MTYLVFILVDSTCKCCFDDDANLSKVFAIEVKKKYSQD